MPRRVLAVAAGALSLVCAAPLRAAAPRDEVTYMAVMINDEKTGYVSQERRAVEGKVTTAVRTVLTVTRGGAGMTITQEQVSIESEAGAALGFESVMNMGLVENRLSGTIGPDGKLKVTQAMGDRKKEFTLDWPAGALLAEGARLEQLRRGLKAGTEYEIVLFMPEVLTAMPTHVTVGEKEKLDLLGRIVEGVKVTTLSRMGGAEIPAVSYVDEQGDALRMDMNLMGMQFSALQCDQAFAVSPVRTTRDFLAASLVPCPAPIPADAARTVFTLKPKPGRKVSLPTTDSQHVVTTPDGALTVTVSRLKAPPGHARPYAGGHPEAQAALTPARFIQSDDPMIVEAAGKAVGDEPDAGAAAARIAAWVHAHMKDRNLSVGYASASEVIRALEGDCTEHAVLTAALCRAAGIPARVANGLLYIDEFLGRRQVLGGHAWTQAFVGGRWIDLDATRPDATTANRILMSTDTGELVGTFAMLNSFGLFDVVAVTAPPAAESPK